jgi:hypothetical protein
MPLSLNTNSSFPPPGNPPYRINREWCVGDSLGYINANTESFVNAFNTLENSVVGQNGSVTNINSKLLAAPIFIPVRYNTLSNQNVIISNVGSRSNAGLNSTTKKYNGPIKRWWSSNFKVSIPSIPSIGNTVGALIHVYFNSNPKGNNSLLYYVKERNAPINNSRYPTTAQSNNYIRKLQMDPTLNKNSFYEAESDITIPVYLDNDKTFSWRISDGKTQNPWAVNPDYFVRVALLGYYVQFTDFRL